ncbi:MAG TPA: DNA-3-methyladenine glycosylase [Candidatus Methylacidiphilales bacterium]|nr:DNA-3-methyladenine glycosylase [Candidatus Methylacidiphilales bacterium]
MIPGRKLVRADYADPRPVRAARFFLGKILCVQTPEGYAEGMMTETEAYGGPRDAASHAFGNRRTARTEVMFAPGGVAYVYLCYGMHQLFNIVTGPVGSPQAVLVRAVKITAGHDLVRQRRPRVAEKDWASGPGRVCAALGIGLHHNGHDLAGEIVWIEDRGIVPPARQIKRTPRIGVNYAGIWALKPWRFVWESR